MRVKHLRPSDAGSQINPGHGLRRANKMRGDAGGVTLGGVKNQLAGNP